MRERPTAVFATNDEMALGVVIAAREQGISVPQDLSLAGFDDIPLSRQIWPALTTIRQPLEEMGWSAVEALLNGKSVKAEIELPFELEVRASTAPPPRD
ncbi:LacI family DNA-binding transcriptional regulator [Phenylobacterium sp. J367]|uniref:LacI family DNA-binding transcriptional regulator n=1 Tax=Phenylobacterium sp. J367 TaxID=2898435 RepID=UPI0035AE6BD3